MYLYSHEPIQLSRKDREPLEIAANSWVEVPDVVGQKAMSVKSHLCDVTGLDNPHDHKCEYLIVTAKPLAETVVSSRLSSQKRRILHKALRRNRTARMAYYGTE